MKNTIYRKILLNREAKQKMIAVLLDPDQCKGRHLISLISILKTNVPDFIFVGGSHTLSSTDSLIELLKDEINSDIILFPGNASQFSDKVDALLFLSLISGRNAEFLIGQHVNSAIAIKKSGLEVIPTAYILIEGGKTSSAEYMSNTRPIPRDKNEIALSTAVAGELLGMRLAYLEAGSGAETPVPPDMINFVKNNLSIPLIVGGGIKTEEDLKTAYDAGADLVVIGNVFESEPEKIEKFVQFTTNYNEKNGTGLA
ncbi:MAG: geranylgeranylglyceryl/heptaprenylglyceryl phosphate synthase [Paludibacter sp.]